MQTVEAGPWEQLRSEVPLQCLSQDPDVLCQQTSCLPTHKKEVVSVLHSLCRQDLQSNCDSIIQLEQA